jgi:hypothetical protein
VQRKASYVLGTQRSVGAMATKSALSRWPECEKLTPTLKNFQRLAEKFSVFDLFPALAFNLYDKL